MIWECGAGDGLGWGRVRHEGGERGNARVEGGEGEEEGAAEEQAGEDEEGGHAEGGGEEEAGRGGGGWGVVCCAIGGVGVGGEEGVGVVHGVEGVFGRVWVLHGEGGEDKG